MTSLRPRLIIIIGIIGVLIVAGAVLGAVLRDGGGDEAETGATLGFLGDGAPDGDVAALSAGVGLAGEARLSASSDSNSTEAPAGEPPALDPSLQGLLDRKIIQSTSVDIRVEDVGFNFQEIIRIADTEGGFVVSSTFSNVDDEQVADLTIRVPGDRYQDVLIQIRRMGEVARESSDANDVTEEFTDLQARLRTLEATERRYLALLGEADGIGEILQVQDRLDVVRGQIEQVQGRINLLEHLTDLATITVHLRPLAAVAQPPADDGPHPLEAASAAWGHSLDALRGLATAFLVVSVFSWWLLPPLAALGIAARWWLSRRPRPAAETST